MAVIQQWDRKTTFLSKLGEVLNIYTEVQVMEFYLGRTPSTSKFCNPFRTDNNPSCTLTWYKGRLLFKDWALGYSWDIVGVAGIKLGIISPIEDSSNMNSKYYYIIEKMYTELLNGANLPKIDTHTHTIKEKEDTIIQVVKRDWTDIDLAYWELTPEQLEIYHIYPISYCIVDGYSCMHSSYKNPTYAYYFPEYSTKDRGIWKTYKPFAKEYNTRKWISNTKANHIFKTW